MLKKYTHEDIKKLGDIEHVQVSAGMYIGNIQNPVHLIEEALDNSLDEAIAGYSKIIAVNIDTKTNIYSTIDDGRGIPLENDTPVLVSSNLHTGAKFNNSKTAYGVGAVGKNGIGLITLLALSDFYIVEIYRDNKHGKYIFENAKLKQKILEDYNEKPPFSTKIQFKPSKKYFETLLPDIDRIRKRLLLASIEIPNVTLVLNVDDKREVISLGKDEFFNKYCLNDSDTNISKIIDINVKDGLERFNIKFCYSYEGTITPRFISSINVLPVEDGGTHVNCFFELLKDFLISKTKKSNLKIQPSDCLVGLRVYFSLELEKPDYSSQSKDKLINRKEEFTKFANKIKLELEKYFSKDPEELNNILTFFDEYRKKLESKKIKTSNVSGKRASTKFTKLRDCTGEHGELYVVEGDSAGSGFVDERTVLKHAILPLKGKIPSIINKDDILKHNEVKELIESLGTGVGPNFDISKLKYDKVISMPDADADGGHIFCLTTLILASQTPEVIKQGHYYLCLAPLYAISNQKSKIFIPLWTQEEVSEAKKKDQQIQRFKGIGEMSPWQLKIACLDENTRRLIRVNWTNDFDKIIKLFSDVNAKRELLKG